MTGNGFNTQYKDNLRRQAESRISLGSAVNAAPCSADRTEDLLHELRVHQVELEMQNEELRRTQQELEHSKARYVELFEQAPIAYLALDNKWLIIDANLDAAKLLEVPRNALLHKPFSNFISAEDQDALYLFCRRLENNSANQSIDIKLKLASGYVFWAYLEIAVLNNNEYLMTVKDISELKETEKALRAASIYTRSLIEASPDPLVTINIDGKITDVNEASVKATGIAREEMIGTDFSAYFTNPDNARRGYLRVFSEGSVSDYPLAIRHVSGKTTDVLYNASTYKDENGNVKGVFAAARDVTARNRVEQELKETLSELEKRVKQRTAALAQANEQMKKVSFELVWAEERERERIAGELHDHVGQSLLLAKMKLDALIDSLESDSLRNSAAEATALVENSIHDIRSLTFRMRPPILDTSGIETALEWLCSSISNDYNLQVEFSNDGRPKPLNNEMRYSLYQAVRELLLNVVKHAGTESAQLDIKTENNRLTVTVSDSGAGFDHPDSHLQHITKGSYGLFNVKQRIEQMDGCFTIVSTPGDGTSVTLTMPLSDNRT